MERKTFYVVVDTGTNLFLTEDCVWSDRLMEAHLWNRPEFARDTCQTEFEQVFEVQCTMELKRRA
jgi:hypothetical protein